MSDAPETIWARPDPYEPDWTGDRALRSKSHVEYRRADLEAPATPPMPLTNAQLMADPRVRALVEALHLMQQTYPYSPPCYGWEAQVKAHKSARAALAQIKEPNE